MLIRLLRQFLAASKRWVLILLVLQIIQTAAGLYLPHLLAKIIDQGIANNDKSVFWTLGGWMMVLSLVQVVFAVVAVAYGSRIANAFGRDVRSALFHRVMAFSAREVGELGAPSLITRITNDVQQVQMLVQIACTMAITAPISLVGGTILALQVDVGLSTILAVAVPFLAFAVTMVVRQMIPTSRRMQAQLDHINKVLREQITGVRVVRAFVREDDEIRRFAGANADLTITSRRAGRLSAFMFPLMATTSNLATIATVWIGASRVEDGATSVGSLVAFMSYLVQILMSIMFASMVAGMVPRASASAERISGVLDTESSVRVPDQPVMTVAEHATVELRNVGFKYPGAEAAVLSGISVRSGPGEMTAIIGATGSGKSTLINLVARLADTTEGTVLVDGVDVRQLDPMLLWQRIGLVPQKPYLFSGTVASNLRYGKPDATDDEIWDALEVSQAASFVRSLDGGLDAMIAQGGANLSGGQRQRLAIPRAVVRRPEIYLFDDSFSALDLATDSALRSALAAITADATVIVVAQRVSTIASADRILVLEQGECVGLGRHHELLATCPTYSEIVASQVGLDDEATGLAEGVRS